MSVSISISPPSGSWLRPVIVQQGCSLSSSLLLGLCLPKKETRVSCQVEELHRRVQCFGAYCVDPPSKLLPLCDLSPGNLQMRGTADVDDAPADLVLHLLLPAVLRPPVCLIGTRVEGVSMLPSTACLAFSPSLSGVVPRHISGLHFCPYPAAAQGLVRNGRGGKPSSSLAMREGEEYEITDAIRQAEEKSVPFR